MELDFTFSFGIAASTSLTAAKTIQKMGLSMIPMMTIY